MWALFQVFFSAIYLLAIILSIPIAFDVGGRDAGLAYSLSLFWFYFVYSSIRVATPARSNIRWALTTMLRASQWVVLPALLIWALNRFSVDDGYDAEAVVERSGREWVTRAWASLTGASTAGGKAGAGSSGWFSGRGGVIEQVVLGGWGSGLRYSSPVFQLLEGFCSLLVIQAAGQITRWLINRGRSDTWVIVLVVFSGSIIASAVYFLWRVACFPQISNLDATLIGVAMTSAVFLGAFGIVSGRGNPVESSLLFAYIVLCTYQIFTDYLPSSPEAAAAQAAAEEQAMSEFPPLPPIIMASYSTLLHALASLPSVFSSSFTFLWAACQTITPSVIISLTYRIIVFYCATRIIPAVRESGAQALTDPEAIWDDSDIVTRILGFVSWFSPSILIAVYTSLLLQHFSVSTTDGLAGAGDVEWTLRAGDAGGSFVRWGNIAATMGLYALELYLGSDGDDHWKTD